MLLKVALIFGLLAVTANVGVCDEDRKEPLKYKPFRPSSPLLDDKLKEAQENQEKNNVKRQLQLRPGHVAPAAPPSREKPEENRPFQYSVQENASQLGQSRAADHAPPRNQRPNSPPIRQPLTPGLSAERRPQRPLNRPPFANQEPSGFGPSLGPSLGPNPGPPQPSIGRVPQPPHSRAPVEFKPFADESDSEEKDDAVPPPRQVRNPRPRPAQEESYQGFPDGFLDGLPKFNFQGKYPDPASVDSRGFLEGFNSFPNFQAIGGFESLGPADRQPGQNRDKRNPEEEPEDRPDKLASEPREERYYGNVQEKRLKRDVDSTTESLNPPIYSDYLLSPSSSVRKSKKRANGTKTSKEKYSKFKVISSKIDVDPEILNKTESTTRVTSRPKNTTRSSPVKDLKKRKQKPESDEAFLDDEIPKRKPASDEAFLDDEINDEFLLSEDFFKNNSENHDNKVAEQRLFPRRNNRQGSEFPSFDIFRPFFDDFISRPERPPPSSQRRPRPRPRPNNDQRFDGSDNSLLGSGNFLVLPGGTFKDYSDYHDYYVNNRYKPYRPDYNDDFFSNFKDFAEINANRRQSNAYRETY